MNVADYIESFALVDLQVDHHLLGLEYLLRLLDQPLYRSLWQLHQLTQALGRDLNQLGDDRIDCEVLLDLSGWLHPGTSADLGSRAVPPTLLGRTAQLIRQTHLVAGLVRIRKGLWGEF